MELEERIIRFTAEFTGVKPVNIGLDSRLAHDLGMDGDDAVEFFKKFGSTFGVDLLELNRHWDQRFVPEGGPGGLGVLVIAAGCGVLGSELQSRFGAIAGWSGGISAGLIAIWVYNFAAQRQGDPQTPIVIVDLVNAARAGKWAMRYDQFALRQ